MLWPLLALILKFLLYPDFSGSAATLKDQAQPAGGILVDLPPSVNDGGSAIDPDGRTETGS